MIGNESFTSSEKLSFLLDGELKREESGTLFYELANDSELQEEFHEMVDLKNMFKDTNMTPPTGLHASIIAGTGLSLGSETSVPAGSKLSGFFGSKVPLMLFSCLTGAFVTFLVMNNGNADNLAASNAPVVNQQKTTIVGESQTAAVTEISNDIDNLNNNNNNNLNNKNKDNQPSQFASLTAGNDNANIDNASTNNTVIHNAGNSTDNNLTNQLIKTEPDLAANYPLLVNRSAQSRPRMIINNSDLSANSFNTVYVPMQELSQSRIRSDNVWAITMRGFTSNSLSDNEVRPLYDPGLNNFSISLMRDLDDNFSFGLEFGQENFMQQYSGEVKGRIANVKQNYLAFWGGAAARYLAAPVDWLDGVQPYGKLFLGSTYLGPLMKEEMGLQYFISKDFAMFFGVELSHLAYFFNNNTFLSNKFGTSYGIVIKF